MRDDLLRNSGDLGIGKEGEIEIGLLVAHEREVEGAGLGLVSCVGAGDGEPARERRLVSRIAGSSGVSHETVTAPATLHHEVAIPRLLIRQGNGKADSELLAVDAFAAIDDTVHTAVCGKRSDGGRARIRWRNGCAGSNQFSLRDLDATKLKTFQLRAAIGLLGLRSRECAEECRRQHCKLLALHLFSSTALHYYDHDRRKTTMRLIGLAMLMATSCCFAQDSGDFKPATSNVLDAQYPRVDSNSRVQIRFKAPDATKVRVNFWSGPKADMEKQADGFWTFTTPPMAPGLHYYTVIVDGAEVSDPGSTAYFGGSKWASAVEVPEAGATYYLPQNVPHGQVREIWYHSNVTGTWRHALVYTPPGYDTSRTSATPCFTCSTAAARTNPGGRGRARRISSSIT